VNDIAGHAQENSFPMNRAQLGWSDFFEAQVEPDDAGRVPMRVANVHRTRLRVISENGPLDLTLPVHATTGDFTVGDWVMADPQTLVLTRCLKRKTVLQRRIEGKGALQLAGANIDTLFIVTSCNADFNIARLERYLALANQAGTTPVILLTKPDTVRDAGILREQAQALQRGLAVIVLNPQSTDAVAMLAPWCGAGQTVAVAGSSGVGKSTLVNVLANAAQETGDIRENDSKGRHTTTSRSLHAIAGGGWIIDTPGMRTLHVSDSADGIETLFAEITELTHLCKFRDCSHAHEPGCAVREAAAKGLIDSERLTRWRKLLEENSSNTPSRSGPRGSGTTAGRNRQR
jgi:ribosome biogenesis GTPase / thiamine phosphate phosphatase